MKRNIETLLIVVCLAASLLCPAIAQGAGGGDVYATKTIAAENTCSDAVHLASHFNFSLSGTWVATVWVQRSFDKGATWMDVGSFTANAEYVGYEPERNMQYRFCVKTGGYTSGSVVGRLSQ